MGRLTVLFLALSILVNVNVYSQDTGLTESERREVLLRLGELSIARERVALLQGYVDRDKEQDAREAELAAREVNAEKQATALAEKEAALWRDQANVWKSSYESVTKGNGKGFYFCKIFTLGLARCK